VLQLLYPDKHNTYFTPRTLASLLDVTGFEVVQRQGCSAHPGRWLRARVSWPVRMATHLVDAASGLVGGRYRMLVFARRRA